MGHGVGRVIVLEGQRAGSEKVFKETAQMELGMNILKKESTNEKKIRQKEGLMYGPEICLFRDQTVSTRFVHQGDDHLAEVS